MALLNSEDYVDMTPYQIYFKMLDSGQYYCSVSTMYRLLRENDSVRERRNQRKHPKYIKPVLKAKGPNQVWTWDITRLRGCTKGEFFYLYVMIDLYSRFTVGWMVSRNENSEQAQHFIKSCLLKQSVDKKNLVIHMDRGAPMTASDTVSLFARLGLTQSFSRPRVSNDNAFSESAFKTLKYHRFFKPEYDSVSDATETLDKFFEWYNNEHMHSQIAFLTPATVYRGDKDEVRKKRFEVLKEAYQRNSNRFASGVTLPDVPEYVGINITKAAKKASHYDG